MDICANHFKAAFGGMLLSSLAMSQTAYPDLVIQNVNWHSGVHHYAVTQKILSPGAPSEPVTITGTADAEFVSGTQVHLTEGFHAGDFHNDGHFHAYIDESHGAPVDVVVIAPEPATHITDNVLHVNKWEKLEIGVRPPQELQDAIDRFFTHYYADPIDPFVSTPGNVDPVHDLNPYADDSLQLVMTLTKPDGAQTLKWGFFMREAKWEGTDNTSLPVEDPDDPLHSYHIRFRIAPDMEGPWQFTLSLKTPNTSTLADSPLSAVLCTGFAFMCDPPLPDNHGPLEVNTSNRRTLRFEDGTPFFGLGLNNENSGYGVSVPACGPGTSWADPNGYRLVWNSYVNMSQGMGKLHTVGANYSRIFLMNKSFAPENVNLGVYDGFRELLQCGGETIVPCTPVVRGNAQYNSWVFDQLLDQARQDGIYIQLCIVPYPPIVAYEPWAWKHDPYLLGFVAPRDPTTGLYDMKRYFYSNGDPATAAQPGSAFYYWKRKYKYILSRWGWSVNIPIIEPFNEIDQMLTYSTVDMTDPDYDNNCAENNLFWPADPALPGTISQWVSDISQFVRGDADLDHPSTSALGYDKKLFLMSYARSEPNLNGGDQYYAPFFNPDVDLIDAHRGMYWGEGEFSNSFNESQDFREEYTSTVDGDTYKKPFHQGESNYYQYVDIDPNDTVEDWKDAAMYFDNYDVSFHNEIWASTFFGNFAAASTWQKERVFWWIRDIPKSRPLLDANNPHQATYPPTAVLHGVNAMDIPGLQDPLLVENRTLYHHFKPLSDFLNDVALGQGDFLDQPHTPHKVYDADGQLECYYLLNEDQTMVIGWIHNLNAYWENHYYVNNQHENYLGCDSPGAQSIALEGLQSGVDYRVNWYPTRMNMTALPTDQDDGTQTGTVTLDLSSLPFNGIHSWPANDNLDTLRSDYAFLIQPIPEHRMVPIAMDERAPTDPDWDIVLYPNPNTGELRVLLPDGPSVDLAITDVTGRLVLNLVGLPGGMHQLDLKTLVSGAYSIRATSGITVKTKLLIKR
jgi:hypothetical protein